MFRTIRRRPHISSESSDDESPQQKKPRRTSFTRKNVHSSTSTAGTSGMSKHIIDNATTSIQKMDIFDSSSTIGKYPTRFRRQLSSCSSDISPRRWHKKPAVITSSDDSINSENEEILHHIRRGALRALSDYESGDSLDRVHKPTVSQEGRASDSSSDGGILRSHSGFKRLPEINPVTSDSSDTSDSGIPVVLNRIRKRRRICSSEESDTNVQNQRSRNMQQHETNRRTRSAAQRDNSDEPARLLNVSSNSSNGRVRRILSTTQSAINRNRRIRAANTSRNQNRVRTRAINMNEQRMVEAITRIVNRDVSGSGISVLSTVNSSIRRSRRSEFNDTTRQFVRTINPIAFERTGIFNTEYVTSEMGRNIIYITPEATFNSRHTEDNDVPFMVPPHNDSSDSDGIVVQVNNRIRFRRAPVIEESDEESTLTAPNATLELADKVTQNPEVSGTNNIITNCSSDSDVESEKCPICLARFNLQEVGNPATCEHSYCVSCIEKWSKSNNTCPVDRLPFQSIVVRSRLQGKVVREISVPTPPIDNGWASDDYFPFPTQLEFVESSESESEYDDMERCFLCSNSNHSDTMIECDNCLQIFHMACLTPPLRYVPATEWFCQRCNQSP